MRFYNINLRINLRNFRIFIKFIKYFNLRQFFNLIGIYLDAFFLVKKPKFKPYSAIIEASRDCTLRCKFCLVNQTKNKFYKEFLDFNSFKKFIDENKQLMFIFFAGFGEPLLNKDLDKMIKYARKKKIISIVSSNGNVFKNISPDMIIFSLDYVDKQKYEYNKGKDLFDITIKNIKRFNDIKSKKTISFLQFLINSQNYNDIDKMKTLHSKLKCDYLILKKTIIYNPEFKDYSVRHKNFFNYPYVNKKIGCKYIYYSTKLNSDGSISFCCNDIYRFANLGNIKEKDFNSIWNSNNYIKLRIKNKKQHIFELCKYCQKLRESPFVKIK